MEVIKERWSASDVVHIWNSHYCLRAAVALGHHDIVDFAKESGVDINFSSHGDSPILTAIEYEKEEMVHHLKRLGSNMEGSLLHAINLKKPRMVLLLVGLGMDVEGRCDVTGRTHLHRSAAMPADASIVCILMKAGADVMAVDKDGRRPSQVAKDKGNVNMLQLLRRMEESVNHR